MIRKFWLISSVLCLGLLWVHCQRETNDMPPPLQEDQFVELYVTLALIQNAKIPEQEKHQKALQVYRHYGVTSETYKQLLAYYQNRPERWYIVFQKIQNRLRQLRETPPKGNRTVKEVPKSLELP